MFYDIFEFFSLIHIQLPTFSSAAALFNEELISLEEETQKSSACSPTYACTILYFMIYLSFSSLWMFRFQLLPRNHQDKTKNLYLWMFQEETPKKVQRVH
jgi:hypothetical protein